MPERVATNPKREVIWIRGRNLRLGIIGIGTVGNAILRGFEGSHEVLTHDKRTGGSISEVTENTDVAYIAVPTPTLESTNECDSSIVESVLNELPDGFSAIIKSTVIPGTTDRLQRKFPKLKIACSPEFLREKSAEIDFQNQEILVVGTEHEDLAELILEHHKTAGLLRNGRFFHVSPTQAEIVKYAKNTFFAIKVIFGNQFQDLCMHMDQDWSDVMEIITSPHEGSIGPSHLGLIPGKRGFDGGCLPKDTLALLTELRGLGLEYNLLEAVVDDNNRIRGS